MTESDPRFEAICAARDVFWSGWGEVDENLLVPLVNPAFQGFPAWPGLRQAYRVVRRGSLTLLATDGLADPFDDDTDDEYPGLGLEFFVMTKDDLGETIASTWLFDALFQVGANASQHGGLRPLIEQYGSLSLELHNVAAPETWQTENGTVGVLLGVPDSGGAAVPPAMDVPPDGVLAVCVKLLTVDELAFVAEHGAEGRQDLLQRLAEAGQAQRSGLTRPSVLA